MIRSGMLFFVLILLSPQIVRAGEADVVGVEVRLAGPATYDFQVTVAHGDEGWGHYADRWEVVAPDGTVLGTRVLLHPHVGEQPFTRGLQGVQVPGSAEVVTVRAHDSVHGYGGREASVRLPRGNEPTGR